MAEQTRLGDALDAWMRRQRVSVAHVAKRGKVSRLDPDTLVTVERPRALGLWLAAGDLYNDLTRR